MTSLKTTSLKTTSLTTTSLTTAPLTTAPLITGLDHVLIRATDLDAAVADYATLMGRPVSWRGEREGAPAARIEADGLSVLLTQAEAGTETEGLAGLGFRVDGIAALRRRLDRLGMGLRETTEGFALAPTDARSLSLSFSERTGAEPAASPDASAVRTLDHVVIDTADGEATAALFGARLGLDLRAVVSNPKWGARLYFFRCGGSIVELAERSDGRTAPDADRFSGLAWRVDDADAVQARIAAAGIDVSEVRDGRKPGTTVFTVRDRTSGVPTLMIRQAPR